MLAASLVRHVGDDLCGRQPVSICRVDGVGRLKFDFHTDEDSAIPPVRESFVVEARDRARRGTDKAMINGIGSR